MLRLVLIILAAYMLGVLWPGPGAAIRAKAGF